jgi:hypothetical protein
MMRALGFLFLFLGSALPATAADFDAPSTFRPNPETGAGRFVFDLEMQVKLRSPQASGPFTVLVNSRDGSMALDNPHASLWGLGMQDVPGLQIHHVIYRSGSMMACGAHPQSGHACLLLGASGWVAQIMPMIADADAERFFTSARTTDQRAAPCCLPETQGLEHLRGQSVDGSYVTFWFDPGTATTATAAPFLGPGVGIIKDFNVRRNRVARHIHVKPSESASFELHLDRLTRINKTVNLSNYNLVTAFTTDGLSQANALSARIMGRGREIQALSREMADTCPKGRAGNDCRTEFRARIKSLEDEIKASALGFGSRHGLPVAEE